MIPGLLPIFLHSCEINLGVAWGRGYPYPPIAMLLTFQEDLEDLSGELGCSALITVAAVVMLSWQLLLKATNQTQQSNPGSWWAERKKSLVSTVCAFHISQ